MWRPVNVRRPANLGPIRKRAAAGGLVRVGPPELKVESGALHWMLLAAKISAQCSAIGGIGNADGIVKRFEPITRRHLFAHIRLPRHEDNGHQATSRLGTETILAPTTSRSRFVELVGLKLTHRWRGPN